MVQKFIPIVNALPFGGTSAVHLTTFPAADMLGRPLRDLRISVTDRCNFRCPYCMPKEIFGADHSFIPSSELLSFDEIARVARLFIALGVDKIRLTGGEPLLRKGIEDLVGMLSGMKTADGRNLDLSLTTNGSLLIAKARALKDAGLKRLTVSLDALDENVFQRMNDVGFRAADVLAGIDAAQAAGFSSIKINMVVKAGVNDGEILPMARCFKDSPHVLRFIEYMDVGASNHWKMEDVVPSDEIIRRIDTEMPLKRLPSGRDGETAVRWGYRDGAGEIGVISSVTQAFCGSCTRTRLSAEGKLYTCLFATSGHDLRALLKSGRTDDEILAAIGGIWQQRNDRYSELRAVAAPAQQDAKRVEMSYIGG